LKAFGFLGLAEGLSGRFQAGLVSRSPYVNRFIDPKLWILVNIHSNILRGDQRTTSEREFSADMLGVLGPPDLSVPALCDAVMHDKDAPVRIRAAISLGALGKHTDGIIGPLQIALEDRDEQVRLAAAQSLWGVAPHILDAVSVLVRLLDSQDPNIVAQSALLLGRFGEKARAASDALSKLMRESDKPRIRLYSASALSRMGRDGGMTLIVLKELLHDHDPFIKAQAARVLGEMEPKAVDVVPELDSVAKKTDAYGRLFIAEALWKITGDRSKSVGMLAAIEKESIGEELKEMARDLMDTMTRAKPG